MRKTLLSLALCLSMLGCGAVQSATPPIAPAMGYSSAADETLGKNLAAVTGFRDQERVNYTNLSPFLQAAEKPYLNTLIDAVNLANTAYIAFHAGTQTIDQAQAAYTKAQSAQTAFTTNVGVK